MKRIDKVMPLGMQQLDIRQPDFERDQLTDRYYLDRANDLINIVNERDLLPRWPSQVVGRAILGLIGYLQDIVADCGVWRTFTDICRKFYGRPLPFFAAGEDYIDYELNREDVRFLTWYGLALNYDEMRTVSPMAPEILEAADIFFEELDKIYDDAPIPECWTMARGLELNNQEEMKQVYSFGSWLFMYCYLMSPAYSMTLLSIMSEPEMAKTKEPTVIEERIEQSMAEDPTGPLALYLGEWLTAIIGDKLPEASAADDGKKEDHPLWEKFTKATEGERIAFFDSYAKLNEFFVKALGWAEGEEHLPQMKKERDFVLLADQKKGMLLAKNICRCIKYPTNPYYDQAYAREHAMDLLTVRGVCPGDLLHFLKEHSALPDARFADSDDAALVADNFDFIARCYLQLYYRGD